MRRFIVAVVALAPLAGSGVAGAQSRWSLETVAAMAYGTEELGSTDLGLGGGLEFVARARVMPHLSLYGGWDWYQFRTDDTARGGDVDVEDAGFSFGLRFESALKGRAAYWLRAGGTSHHIEVEDGGGNVVFDTDHGLGWEVGGGITIPIEGSLTLTPGVRYRALSRDVVIDLAPTTVDLRYLTFGVGIAIDF